jgi:hypothetical protein
MLLKILLIKLIWTRPNTNYEDIYSYLIYLGEPNKDVTMFTIKSEPNKLFYTKRFDNLDPTIKYKIKVRAVSNNGISADSNIVEIQPMNKNQVPGRPSNPFVNKITCLPDGTYKTAATCIKSVFPTVDDMSEHNNLMDKLSAQKKESFLNL